MITWQGSGNSYMQSVAISGRRYSLIDWVYIGAMVHVAGMPHVDVGVHNSSVPSLRGGANGKKGANHHSDWRPGGPKALGVVGAEIWG